MNTAKKITDTIFTKYETFLHDVCNELCEDGHITKKHMKELLSDGRVILSLEDRYIILTTGKSNIGKEKEVKFEFIVKRK